MKNQLIKYSPIIAIGLIVILALISSFFPLDSEYTIYRTIRAYQHLPNGNTKVYYHSGAIEIEGIWFFNLDTQYEFYRELNSTQWKVDPY